MENGILGGILLAVLVIAVFIVVRTKIKRVGIKRTCCGGHSCFDTLFKGASENVFQKPEVNCSYYHIHLGA